MDTLFFSFSLPFSLIIFASILSPVIYSFKIQCNERDHYLLLNFKHTLVDPSAILSNWSDERDCCEWEGVHCDNTTGRVIKLSLPCPIEYQQDNDPCSGLKKSHCLAGQLHLMSLFHLEFLNYLDLSNQNFHAVVQNDYVVERHYFYENSSNLHRLDLSYNKDLHFDSLDWLSRVPSLKYVNFSGINLQGRVDWHKLATLVPFLTEMYFDSCQLSDISPSLRYANFTSLEVLSLRHNAFSSEFIPDWIVNFSEITTIDLSGNHFRGQLPKKLLNLKNIRSLIMYSNKFTGPIPDWLGQLEHLQDLDVSNNSFSGPIPSSLGNISSLTLLDARSNYLNGNLPESLGQLLNLERLYLSDNHLTGYVSERYFAKLSNLKYLSVGSPGLIFDFDSLWVPPFQLEEIYLQHMVGPKLPEWIYTQASLTKLTVTDSIISFEHQDKFWDFVARVPYIALEDNTIHGDMSSVLLNSTYISLRSNKLKGKLPQLSQNVILFTVRDNSFQGSISSLLCPKMNWRSKLQLLNLSRNLLSGGLTNCWTHWSSLVIVWLNSNNLTGTIPPSISLLSNLVVLHLNGNNLFGEMPFSLMINCKKLQVLDVGENKLSGFLTNWMAQNAKILRLRSNQLSGNIPPQLCQLASLTILDFADNKISGPLPICLQNLTAMTFPNSSNNGVKYFCITTPTFTYAIADGVMVHIKGRGLSYKKNLKFLHAIDLSSNNVSGSIPPEIFSLAGLQSLNLSHNQLEGNIPKEIGNLNNLESLDLSMNQFSGEIPQSLGQLSFLGTLNLSFNNFIGKIPSGTQVQGFNASSYIGSPRLCGTPLPKNCADQNGIKPVEENDNQENEFLSPFYSGLGVGFATAFWGVCAVIFFNRNFRHSYFRFLYHIRDKLYVIVVLRMNRFRR